MTTSQNLDARINNFSYEMVDELKEELKNELLSLIDKALGVLSNDGVYGYYVYCKSKKKEVIFKKFIKDMVDEFKNVVLIKDERNGVDYNNFFIQLSEDLRSLLFFKDIIEKILIYARYHAKALVKSDE